jgi:hypothetical protein
VRVPVATVARCLAARGLAVPGGRASGRAPPASGSLLNSPTSVGRPTSPTTRWPVRLARRPGTSARHPHPAPGAARRVHQLPQHPPPAQSLPGPATPATAYAARPKAAPGDRSAGTHDRLRTGKIGSTGTVTLRHGGRLDHLGAGRTHARTHTLLLIQVLYVKVIAAATGELLRELTPGPSRNYQPTGKPRRPSRTQNPEPAGRGFGAIPMS